MFSVNRKIPTLGSTAPVGNSASLLSHWNGGSSGWDIPVPTEYQWWILFIMQEMRILYDFLASEWNILQNLLIFDAYLVVKVLVSKQNPY